MSMSADYSAVIRAFAPFEPRPQVRVEFWHSGQFVRGCGYHGTVEEALSRALEHLEMQARCRALRRGTHEVVAGDERRGLEVD